MARSKPITDRQMTQKPTTAAMPTMGSSSHRAITGPNSLTTLLR
jgi:hypothetical protein